MLGQVSWQTAHLALCLQPHAKMHCAQTGVLLDLPCLEGAAGGLMNTWLAALLLGLSEVSLLHVKGGFFSFSGDFKDRRGNIFLAPFLRVLVVAVV